MSFHIKTALAPLPTFRAVLSSRSSPIEDKDKLFISINGRFDVIDLDTSSTGVD